MLRNNDHFVVLSNAFTDNIGHIQVFDSNAHNYLPSISSGPFLNPKNCVAKAIKSLQPKAWIVSFMDCMQQTDSSSCGPLALLNFWSLISGIPPHHVKYSTEVPHLRESIHETIASRKLQPLLKTKPEPCVKLTMKTYRMPY